MWSMILVSLISSAANLHPRFEKALPDEEGKQKQIVRGILGIQEQAKLNGKKLRGTHSKGVCAKGTFEIFKNQGSLNKGIFSHAGNYPATVRFANAASKIDSDQAADVRSISMSLSLPASISNPQGKFDFSMNNAPTFPINDAAIFADIMTIAEKGLTKGGWEIGWTRLMAVKNAFSLGEAQKSKPTAGYQRLRYFSGVPFLLGNDQAVKYSLRPCSNNFASRLGNGENALTEELNRHLTQDSNMACFDLEVQVLDETKMTDTEGKKHAAPDWIENATWEWKEAQVPFVKVGRLTLEKNSTMNASACETLRFNVNVNTNETHRGLGNINRARTWAEHASSEKRDK